MAHWTSLAAAERRDAILRALSPITTTGWREPDAAPTIDPATGAVRDFVGVPAAGEAGGLAAALAGLAERPVGRGAGRASRRSTVYDRLPRRPGVGRRSSPAMTRREPAQLAARPAWRWTRWSATTSTSGSAIRRRWRSATPGSTRRAARAVDDPAATGAHLHGRRPTRSSTTCRFEIEARALAPAPYRQRRGAAGGRARRAPRSPTRRRRRPHAHVVTCGRPRDRPLSAPRAARPAPAAMRSPS